MKIKICGVVMLSFVIPAGLQADSSVPKNILKAATATQSISKKLPRRVSRPVGLVYADTQQFISQTGHRPRCQLHQDGRCLMLYQMTPIQQAEIRLGSEINRVFVRAKEDALLSADPDVVALRTLVEAYPNSQPQYPLLDPQPILEQTKIFLHQHHMRPRVVIYADGGYNKTKEEMTPQEVEEHMLGYRINRLIEKMELYPPKERQIILELKNLVEQYPRFKPVDTQEVYQQLQAFMDENGRFPSASTTYQGKYISIHELSPQKQQEIRLGRSARTLMQQAKQGIRADDPYVKAILALYAQQDFRATPMPTPADLLEQLQVWVTAHGGYRPRFNIYQGRLHIPVEQMTPQQYEEHVLARRLDYYLHRGVEDTHIREALWNISQLPTGPDWFDDLLPTLLKDLQTWSAAHGNLRPRLNIYREGKRVPVAQLSEEELQEYMLAQRLSHALSKGVQDSALRAALEEFNQLPTRVNQHAEQLPNLLEDLQTWSGTHGNLRPRLHFYRGHSVLSVAQLSEEELQERRLAQRLVYALKKGVDDPALRAALEEFNQRPVFSPKRLLQD